RAGHGPWAVGWRCGVAQAEGRGEDADVPNVPARLDTRKERPARGRLERRPVQTVRRYGRRRGGHPLPIRLELAQRPLPQQEVLGARQGHAPRTAVVAVQLWHVLLRATRRVVRIAHALADGLAAGIPTFTRP